MRYKLWISIRGDMRGDSMLGEHMGDKEFCQLQQSNDVIGGDEDTLFG